MNAFKKRSFGIVLIFRIALVRLGSASPGTAARSTIPTKDGWCESAQHCG